MAIKESDLIGQNGNGLTGKIVTSNSPFVGGGEEENLCEDVLEPPQTGFLGTTQNVISDINFVSTTAQTPADNASTTATGATAGSTVATQDQGESTSATGFFGIAITGTFINIGSIQETQEPTKVIEVIQEKPTMIEPPKERKGSRYVLKSLVSSLDNYKDNLDPSVYTLDPLRTYAGYFWYKDDVYTTNPLISIAKDRTNAAFDYINSFQQYLYSGRQLTKLFVPFLVSPMKKKNIIDSVSYYLEQTWFLDINDTREIPVSTIEKISERLKGQKFYDIVFDTRTPTELNKINSSVSSGELLIKIENEYNAYVSSYEKMLNNINIPANALPNMYVLLAENLKDPRNLMNLEDDIMGEIKAEAYQKALQRQNPSGKYNLTNQNFITSLIQHIPDTSSNADEYIDRFSQLMSSDLLWAEPRWRTLYMRRASSLMTNVILSSRELKIYKEFKSFREQFPFYININVDSPALKTIGNNFYENGVIDYIISYVSNKRSDPKYEKNFLVQDNSFQETTREITSEVFDIKQIFKDLRNNITFDNNKHTYVGLLEKQINDFGKQQKKEKMDLALAELEYDLLTNDLKERHRRTMYDCFVGNPAYNELLFYRIDKYEITENLEPGNPASEQASVFLQSFYIPATDEDKLDYIDTQIKYEKRYEYRIYAYNYVLANEYEYSTLWMPQGKITAKDTKPQTQINNLQKGFLVENYIYTISGIVVDKPGAMPEVTIVPFKDNSKDILMLFNPSTVEYNLVDIPFNENEVMLYNKIRESQQKQEGEKLRFGGDDKVKEYYIYRIESYPKSYDDFYDAFYQSVRTKCNCTSAEVLEQIEPNKKYYYIFRSVDVHDNISYPSPVYEVELVNENSMIFLKTNVVPFADKEYKKSSKSVRRLLHIRPSSSQTLLLGKSIEDYENGVTSDIKIGDHNNLNNFVWGKNFKMRIRSKKTGKFIDVKFKFEKETGELLKEIQESCEE